MTALSTYISRHAQALLAAFGRILRRPLGSLLTVLVIAVALTLPGILWLVVKNAQAAAGAVTSSLELAVYFKTDTALERAEQLAATTRQRKDVARVTLVSADQGLAEFREYSGFGAALDALEGNPLPHVLTVEPQPQASSPAAIETLRRYLASWPEVEIVQLDGEWVKRLAAILDLARQALAVFAVLLGVGVLAVVGNAIRLEIGARRAEIEVTKLVGGSNAFVRRPFLYAGLAFGLLGGTIALALLVLLTAVLGAPVARVAALYGGGFTLVGPTVIEGLILIAGAAVLGWLGAWVGAARLIARIEPKS